MTSLYHRVWAALPAIGIVLALAAGVLPAAAQTKSTWDTIQETKVLRVGAIDGREPYWKKDQATGEWRGFIVDMAKDLARELGAKVEFVDSTFATAVLDLQANKIDIMFAVRATPARAKAIDFAGPTYSLGFVMVNNKNFQGRTWEDYNKPEVKLSAEQGSASAAAGSRYAPKAQLLTFQRQNEAILAVQSGRADAMVTTALEGVAARAKNPELGDFVSPTPERALPTHVGVRREADKTFRDFVNTWAEYNRLLGNFEDMIVKSLDLLGIARSDIPEQFKAQ
jgi:polar amino acid transport system substrate-binding protein